MTEPLVSVIIPVYNVFPYLREALDSVINQTYRNLEILVIDDGSTDGSGAVCDEYRIDSRVTVIHQENRGLSGARNTGLDQMTGDYVAFLDPDDAFMPNMIEVLMNCIHQNQTDIAACGYDLILSEGCMIDAKRKDYRSYSKEAVLTVREVLIALLEAHYSFSIWSKIYHRRIWEGLRFLEGHVYEDVWIAPQILEVCELITVVSRVLIHHRLRTESITHTNSAINTRDYLQAIYQFLAFAEQKNWAIPVKHTRNFRERYLRIFIFTWADLRLNKNATEAERLSEEMVNNIRQQAREIGKIRQMKTKVTWWLFRYCPGFIHLARAIYRELKAAVHQGLNKE